MVLLDFKRKKKISKNYILDCLKSLLLIYERTNHVFKK